VAFASKSFLCGAMARLAFEEGLCIDVATGGELDLVLRSGVPAGRVIMHGKQQVGRRVRARHRRRGPPTGRGQLRRDWLAGTLVDASSPLDCLVRVTPGVEAHTHEFVRTGQEDTKFGFSVATGDARKAIDELRSIPGLTLHGVHAHIGSQVFELIGFVDRSRSWRSSSPRTISTNCVSVGDSACAYVAGGIRAVHSWSGEDAIRVAAHEVGSTPNVRLLAEPGRATSPSPRDALPAVP